MPVGVRGGGRGEEAQVQAHVPQGLRRHVAASGLRHVPPLPPAGPPGGRRREAPQPPPPRAPRRRRRRRGAHAHALRPQR